MLIDKTPSVLSSNFASISEKEPDPSLNLEIIIKSHIFKVLIWSNARKRWENHDGTENTLPITRWAYLR